MTGNAIANNASILTLLTAGNIQSTGYASVSGNITSNSNVLVAGYVSVAGNVIANNANIVTLLTAGNITSPGTISVAGNVTANANVFVTANLSVAGNIISNSVFYGNGSGLTNIAYIGDIANLTANSSVVTDQANNTVSISSGGTGNLAVFSVGLMAMLGAFANPKNITEDIIFPDGYNGLMIGPLNIDASSYIEVPNGTTIHIVG
jgi:cytoskeletal protein CcmA (bactofilin family)